MSKNNRVKKEAKHLERMGFDPRDMPTDIQDYRDSKLKKIETKTENHRRYLSVLQNNADELVIACGAAGTGKTWMATAVACDLYRGNHFRQLILTTPTVQCGEKLGHLPGELEDKYAPYIEPFEDVLNERLGVIFKNDLNKRILPKPLQYMRGKTFDNAIIICDEAQNTTVDQMKMLITRVGYNCRLFLTGDTGQNDLKKVENGLSWLIRQIEKQNTIDEVIKMTKADNMRSEFCGRMLDIIENEV